MEADHFHNEAALVEACLKNDRQAQRELYQRYVRMLKGICLRYTGNEADAEDLLQESFIRIFGKLNGYRDQGQLGGWLRKVTVNCALQRYRSQKLERESTVSLTAGVYAEAELDYLLNALEAEDLLRYIQALPDGFRTVFNLYAIEGYKHHEIADLLGISEGTSKSQLSRARSWLVEKLKQEEVRLKKSGYVN